MTSFCHVYHVRRLPQSSQGCQPRPPEALRRYPVVDQPHRAAGVCWLDLESWRDIPSGGFPASVIGETIWTGYKEVWQCRRQTPVGIDLACAAQLMQQVDAAEASLDEHHRRALADYKSCVNEFTRVFNDW
jgi:hypothetical protein